jgi:hypothetical protein
MALSNTELYDDIKNSVIAALNTVTTNVPKIEGGKSAGEEPLNIFDADKVETKYGTSARKMTYSEENYSGIEVIVEIIADKVAEKVINHFKDNIKSSLLERFELLESDFDSFVTSMLGVGAGPSTAVPAAVAAFLLTSNTVQRVSEKLTATGEETPTIIYGRT